MTAPAASPGRTLNIRFPDRMLAPLRYAAAGRGMTLASYIREAVRKELVSDQKNPSPLRADGAAPPPRREELVPFHFRVPPAMRDRLQREAEESGMTAAAYVRAAVQKALDAKAATGASA